MLIKRLAELRSNGATIGLIVLEATGGSSWKWPHAQLAGYCSGRDQSSPGARFARSMATWQERSHRCACARTHGPDAAAANDLRKLVKAFARRTAAHAASHGHSPASAGGMRHRDSSAPAHPTSACAAA